MSARASATPSTMPMTNVLAPRPTAMYSGSSEWTSSDDRSMQRLTMPSAHTPRGIAARPRRAALAAIGVVIVSRLKLERVRQIACIRAYAGQWLEREAARDELDDRRRIVGRVIDVAALRERRDDDRRNARSRSPTISLGRRNVVPESAVLVVRHDDRRRRPQGARPDLRNQFGNVN